MSDSHVLRVVTVLVAVFAISSCGGTPEPRSPRRMAARTDAGEALAEERPVTRSSAAPTGELDWNDVGTVAETGAPAAAEEAASTGRRASPERRAAEALPEEEIAPLTGDETGSSSQKATGEAMTEEPAESMEPAEELQAEEKAGSPESEKAEEAEGGEMPAEEGAAEAPAEKPAEETPQAEEKAESPAEEQAEKTEGGEGGEAPEEKEGEEASASMESPDLPVASEAAESSPLETVEDSGEVATMKDGSEEPASAMETGSAAPRRSPAAGDLASTKQLMKNALLASRSAPPKSPQTRKDAAPAPPPEPAPAPAAEPSAAADPVEAEAQVTSSPKIDKEAIRLQERRARAGYYLNEAKRLLEQGDRAAAEKAGREAIGLDPALSAQVETLLSGEEKAAPKDETAGVEVPEEGEG